MLVCVLEGHSAQKRVLRQLGNFYPTFPPPEKREKEGLQKTLVAALLLYSLNWQAKKKKKKKIAFILL